MCVLETCSVYVLDNGLGNVEVYDAFGVIVNFGGEVNEFPVFEHDIPGLNMGKN